MAGLMDPVGPENIRTYWIRRAVVGGVVLVVLIAVIALVASLNGGRQSAEPPPVTGPSLQPEGNPTPTNTPAVTPTGSATSGQPSASSTASTTGSAKTSTSATTSAKSSATTSTSQTSKAPTTPAPPKPVACKPGDLRTTLTGPRSITAGKAVKFSAGVINGGTTECRFVLDPESYVFRVHSGTDRIWSTGECTKWLPKVDRVLKPQEDVSWEITWTVERSKDCGLVKDPLRAGTYAANSLLDGAPPAQLVMQLK